MAASSLHCLTVFLSCLHWTSSVPADPVLNQSATVNTRVVLPCNTSKSAAVLWSFQSRDGGIPIEVSIYGEIVGKYKDIYELDKARAGEFNLVIKSARSADSGQYMCDEENGVGDHHLIYLTVSGQDSTASDQVQSTTATNCNSEQHLQPASTAGWIAAVVVLICLLVLAVSMSVAMYVLWLRKSRSQPTGRPLLSRSANVEKVEPDAPQPDSTQEKTHEKGILREVKELASKYSTTELYTTELYGNRIRDAFVYYITRHHDEFEWCVRRMVAHIHALNEQPDIIVGLNAYGSRGDILAWHTAYSMKMPYAEIAKVGASRRKDVEKVDFVTGPAEERKIYTLEMVKDACQPNQNAVIIGSVVANGGTMKKAWDLLRSSKFKVHVIAYLCFIKSTSYDQDVDAPKLFHVLEMDLK